MRIFEGTPFLVVLSFLVLKGTTRKATKGSTPKQDTTQLRSQRRNQVPGHGIKAMRTPRVFGFYVRVGPPAIGALFEAFLVGRVHLLE